MRSLRICVVGPTPDTPGGVTRSTLLLIYIYNKILNHDVFLIPTSFNIKEQILNLKLLKRCDVIHTQGPLQMLENLALLFYKKSKKILTLRGWILEEVIVYFRNNPEISILRRFIVLFYTFINWLIHKTFLIPFVYDYITAVSKVTAHKNKVREAIIIPNPVLCNIKNPTLSTKKSSQDIVFVTYVSIGGGKIESIPYALLIVNLINKKVGSKYRVRLEIYGKDLPKYILDILSRFNFVDYKGFVKDYTTRIKNADLFIAPYTFPELGHASLEAVCVGVPVAKFTDNPQEEEIIDMYNGILLNTDSDTIKKLIKYINSIDQLKHYVYINAYNTILRRRNINVISLYWKSLVEN